MSWCALIFLVFIYFMLQARLLDPFSFGVTLIKFGPLLG